MEATTGNDIRISRFNLDDLDDGLSVDNLSSDRGENKTGKRNGKAEAPPATMLTMTKSKSYMPAAANIANLNQKADAMNDASSIDLSELSKIHEQIDIIKSSKQKTKSATPVTTVPKGKGKANNNKAANGRKSSGPAGSSKLNPVQINSSIAKKTRSGGD